MRGLRRLANEVKPEFWLMGEVIHGDYSRWANPEMLHSVTNYELHKGLWSGHNDHNYFRDRPHHAPSAGPVPRYPAVSVLG